MGFKRADIDETIWTDDNLEVHYWAGLIAADGCLSIKKGKYRTYNYIHLWLAGEDGQHVQSLFDFMKCSYKVGKKDISKTKWASKNFYQMGGAFWSDHVWNWLHGHGITERKSLTLQVSDLLAKSPDFWRGIIDGDGTVNFAKNRGLLYPHIGVGGSQALMHQFQSFIQHHLGKSPKIGTCRSIFRIALNGGVAQDLIGVLYGRPGPALPRKAQAAVDCLAWTNAKPTLRRGTLIRP